ncbi:hypothetical protein Tco_0077438 [Tanacetum coccineum]
MGEKELSTIPEKDKSSVENLVPIPSGSKGVSNDICDNDHSDAKSLLSQDIPITSPKIDFLPEEFASEFVPIPPGMNKDEFDEEEDDCYNTTSDDDSYENIEYVEASSLNLEYDSLEEENEDHEEKEFDLEDIFQIQDVILREKLLNVHRLITNIESLKTTLLLILCSSLLLHFPFLSWIVWICQISQEISQKQTRERMSDQEAKELKAEAREIMPQPSTVNCS